MTEAEWLACGNAMVLFNYLSCESPWREAFPGQRGWVTRVGDWVRQHLSRTARRFNRSRTRRLYLLACGVNRHWWRARTGETEVPPHIVLEELFAEGKVTLDELLADDPERQWWWPDPWHLVSNVFRRAFGKASDLEATWGIYCDLTRDIFGNPFRPVVFSPDWRTSTVLALARQMYESRDFSAMPILADALQDAGCEDAQILDHCRGPNPHVRGCFVVDQLLGKG